MFAYSDPGETLSSAALANYRLALHVEYSRSSGLADSAFTMLEAFDEVPPESKRSHPVEWAAFPRAAGVGNDRIDRERFRFQDEYVEWATERANGRLARVVFTTEFSAYYAAVAAVGFSELVAAIQVVIPGANPTQAELFGPGFNATSASPQARASRFRTFAQRNVWINGQKGAICLAHGSSTLTALFRLVDVAAIPKPDVQAGAICESLGDNCVPERNSDPNIANAVQGLALDDRSITLNDPAGIEIAGLTGIWRIGNREIEINDPASNDGLWRVSRSGRRGQLTVHPDLFLDDRPISSGAQVAAALRVKATVISALNHDLPEWARVGHEGSTRLTELANGDGE